MLGHCARPTAILTGHHCIDWKTMSCFTRSFRHFARKLANDQLLFCALYVCTLSDNSATAMYIHVNVWVFFFVVVVAARVFKVNLEGEGDQENSVVADGQEHNYNIVLLCVCIHVIRCIAGKTPSFGKCTLLLQYMLIIVHVLILLLSVYNFNPVE